MIVINNSLNDCTLQTYNDCTLHTSKYGHQEHDFNFNAPPPAVPAEVVHSSRDHPSALFTSARPVPAANTVSESDPAVILSRRTPRPTRPWINFD